MTAADLKGCSRQAIAEAIQRGAIDGEKVGRNYVVRDNRKFQDWQPSQVRQEIGRESQKPKRKAARRGVGTFKRPAKSQLSSPRGRWGPKPGPGKDRESPKVEALDTRDDTTPLSSKASPNDDYRLAEDLIEGRAFDWESVDAAIARNRDDGCFREAIDYYTEKKFDADSLEMNLAEPLPCAIVTGLLSRGGPEWLCCLPIQASLRYWWTMARELPPQGPQRRIYSAWLREVGKALNPAQVGGSNKTTSLDEWSIRSEYNDLLSNFRLLKKDLRRKPIHSEGIRRSDVAKVAELVLWGKAWPKDLEFEPGLDGFRVLLAEATRVGADGGRAEWIVDALCEKSPSAVTMEFIASPRGLSSETVRKIMKR